MTALITATAWLVASVAFVLLTIFLLRMVKPFTSAIAMLAERKARKPLPQPLLKLIESRIAAFLDTGSDGPNS